MTKPLLIGETPSRAEGPDAWRAPLSGKIAKRICKMANISTLESTPWYTTLRAHFDCVNAFITPTEIPSDLDNYLWLQAKTHVEQSIEMYRPACVVCLGRNAAVAAGLYGYIWFEWWRHRRLLHVVIPHPSGLNRLYNDPDIYDTATHTLQTALEISERARD